MRRIGERRRGFIRSSSAARRFPLSATSKGPDLERGTGIAGAELRGAHLRLPGHGTEGPTLEIFNYNILEDKPAVAINRPGFGHIAFVVDDVRLRARQYLLQAGSKWGKWSRLRMRSERN